MNIEDALDQQQDISAVEKFTLQKDMRQISDSAQLYQELIPKQTPGPGQQYAFEVNLDQCTGCKACVVACHNENGLEEDETWRSVGLIHGGSATKPVIQHVTSACHHCLEPACMTGCPVEAYEKDPVTGVVKHLEDQCIGCQYCILKCPYDVPKYNKKKGIVHKCDMCISRLEVGQAPACVRACPNGAIRITLVDTQTVRRNPTEFVDVPQAPDASYTLPTTVYKTNKKFPVNMVASEDFSLKPEHAHMPLVIMLVLTQLSVGAFGVQLLFNHFIPGSLRALLAPVHTWMTLSVGAVALLASIFHLGRPQYAYRAVLGLKTSWLSREIVVFCLFALLACIYAFFPTGALAAGVVAAGLLGVFCSVMVYKDTRRPLWDSTLTNFKFFMTTMILGGHAILFVSIAATFNHPVFNPVYVMRCAGITLVVLLTLANVIKIGTEAVLLWYWKTQKATTLKKIAMLMTEHLCFKTLQRFIYGIAGGIILPVLFLKFYEHWTNATILSVAVAMMILTLTAEMLERYLFFRAVVPLRMPK